jgi:argininosuccinate lyase
MAPHLQARRDDMRDAAKRGFSTATDLADYVVRKGIPFRDAHEIVGKAVAYGLAQGKDLSDMTLEELQQFSAEISADVFEVLTLEGSVAARNHIGGTAPDQVRAAAIRANSALADREENPAP